MKYEGDIEDLVFAAFKIGDLFVVRFQGVPYAVNHKKIFYDSAKGAETALRHHIYCNFCQGHYWHLGKKNTFAKEKGWMRNNGKVADNAKEFKTFAKEMTKQLLADKIFTIEKINI